MAVSLPEWLEELRKTEIVRRVRNDPRSTAGAVLGIARDVAMEAAGWGQADFDSPWGNLTAEDRALLYAYFFQKGHLEELFEAFRQIFADARPDNPIVVDLGCGPFTGWLAFAGALGGEPAFDYIGVDRSQTMCRLGERLAAAAAQFDESPRIARQWATEIASVSWESAPSWRPVIVIVSYLLASPTLDAEQLIVELDDLLAKLGRGPVTVLYTNSTRHDANRSFPAFRAALGTKGFDLYADDTGEIEIARLSGTRLRELRYALFRRQRRDTLRLGD